jgi:predicted enzyme related to lactoylglutathione lyase
MPGPASAGVFVYALDLATLAHFYQTVLGLERRHQTHELIVLEAAPLQLVVHAMPPELAALARAREARPSAVKFFFTVPSLGEAAASARALGGETWPEVYRGPGFLVMNFVDPEGNVFHVRERLADGSAA